MDERADARSRLNIAIPRSARDDGWQFGLVGLLVLAVAVAVLVIAPLPSMRASAFLDGNGGDVRTELHSEPFGLRYPPRIAAERFTDPGLAVSIMPPAGWEIRTLAGLAL